jgi:hypothetical protein
MGLPTRAPFTTSGTLSSYAARLPPRGEYEPTPFRSTADHSAFIDRHDGDSGVSASGSEAGLLPSKEVLRTVRLQTESW